YHHQIVLAAREYAVRCRVDGKAVWAGAGRDGPTCIDPVGPGIDPKYFLLLFAVDIDLAGAVGRTNFQLSAAVQRRHCRLRLGIDDRDLARIAIDDEYMPTGRIEDDRIGIRLRFDGLERPQPLPVETGRHARLSVVRVAASGTRYDDHPVGASGIPLDVADD